MLIRGKRSAVPIILPASASASFDPLVETFNRTTERSAPQTVATITPTYAGATPTYSLIGTHAVGFSVENSGNNAVVKCYDRRKMVDNGIRVQSWKTRTFTVRATVGATTSDCSLTLTLDTSGYAGTLANNVVGIDVQTGRTSTNTLQVASASNQPTGWTVVEGSTWRITPNSDNQTLTDWDLRGFYVYNSARNGIVLTNCLLGPTANTPLPPSGGLSAILRCGNSTAIATPMNVINCTIDMDSSGVQWTFLGMEKQFGTLTKVAILGAQGDGAAGVTGYAATDLYISTGPTAKYDSAGAVITNGTTGTGGWGHSDGIQPISPLTPCTVDGFTIFDLPQPFMDGATITTLAGTTAFTINNSNVTNSAGAFTAGLVGKCIRIPGMSANQHVITAFVDASNITIGSSTSNGAIPNASGTAYYFDLVDAYSQVNSPTYLQVTGGVAVSSEVSVSNGLALGGSNVIQTLANASIESLIKWRNVGLGDFAGSYAGAYGPTATATGIYDFRTGSTYADIRPVPTTPASLTKTGATTSSITFTFTNQDASILYQYRYRTTAGPGAWSAYATATPAGTTISGLAAATSYDIEVIGSNCLATSGTYLQVSSAASLTASTN